MPTIDKLQEIQAIPAFGFEDERGLKPLAWEASAAHKHLLYFLARQPTALLQHVQRINLAVLGGSQAKAHSALLDLFLVLGSKGKAIRAEMLSLVMPLLNEEQVAFYLERMESGIFPNSQHPKAVYSIFSQGLEGEIDAVNAEVPSIAKGWHQLDWLEVAQLLG